MTGRRNALRKLTAGHPCLLRLGLFVPDAMMAMVSVSAAATVL